MISAKALFSVGLSILAIALIAAFFVLQGIESLRLVIYVAVPCGVLVVAIGLIGVMTGRIKDDLHQ
jgi:purine-cytosine permease-like protein